MILILERISDNGISTIGKLTVGEFNYVTIEDTFRIEKIAGETRIPAGEYEVKLRTWGSHHEKYLTKFPRIHKGMLQLQDVPGFSDILIHIGNSAKDTKGCIIVGIKVESDYLISGSTVAYSELYPVISSVIESGEKVTIKITDNDRKS